MSTLHFSCSSPEHALLLAASRPRLDAEGAERIVKLSKGPINWEYLSQQAAYHGTSGLVYANLHAAGLRLDAAQVAPVVRIARDTANRNLYLQGELIKILAAFQTHHIPAMPIKGPVLAMTVYGDLACRQFSDLDLLIHEHDIAQARALLARAGFRCIRHPQWIEPYLSFAHELDFIRDDGDIHVDLQWRFGKKWLALPITPEHVWKRSRSVCVGGQQLTQPSLEDTALILCIHGYRHFWSRLKWIIDMAAFMNRFGGQLDSAELLERARAGGGVTLLTLGLWLAREIGGAAIPSTLLRCVDADIRASRLGRAVVDHLCRDATPGPRGSQGTMNNVVFHWTARERLRDRLPLPGPFAAHGTYVLRRRMHHHIRRLLRHRSASAKSE